MYQLLFHFGSPLPGILNRPHVMLRPLEGRAIPSEAVVDDPILDRNTYLLLYFNTFVLLVIISNTIYHIINKIYHNKVNIFIFTVSFKVKTTLNINTQVHMTKQTKNSPI